MGDMVNGEEVETWDDWVADGNDVTFSCLFCHVEVKNEESLHTHLEEHQFSLLQQISMRNLDMYATIQLVNFLRTMHQKGLSVDEILKKLDAEGDSAFRCDEFLQPVIRDDPLLYCLATADDDDSEDDEREEKGEIVEINDTIERRSSFAPSTSDVLERLQVENQQLKQQLLSVSSLMRDFVIDDEKITPDDTMKPADNDTYYFDSYSHVGIHREMITDRVRTDGYRNAILNNPELFKGKIVLDVGCGTGILSMFAAQAGAARVIGIDCSEMGSVANEIVRDNGFGNIITIIRGKVEEIELPVQSVDVIISEWMGYCLLYEAMLDTVLFARDKWLAPSGHLFPDKCSLHIQGIYDSKQRIGFWDEVYGFDMKAIKSKISVRDGFVEDVDPQDVLTDRALLKHIDIDHITYEELDFRSDFKLVVMKSGTMHGFVSSFDIGFERDCLKPEYFTTGVEGIPTHWHQVFFHVDSPFDVKVGETIEGKWWIRRNAENPRYLDVELEWKHENKTTFSSQSFRVHD